MNKLFVYIYCQPLQRLCWLMLSLVVLWGYLGFRERNSLRWRLFNAAVFIGITAVIFYMTVYTRGETADVPVLVPFQSFREAKIQPELYRSMLMNVFLFVPLGMSGPFVLGKGRWAPFLSVILSLAFSAGIEYLQYTYALGRCEVDDVIMNTLGALLGSRAHWLYRNWERCVKPILHKLKGSADVS